MQIIKSSLYLAFQSFDKPKKLFAIINNINKKTFTLYDDVSAAFSYFEEYWQAGNKVPAHVLTFIKSTWLRFVNGAEKLKALVVISNSNIAKNNLTSATCKPQLNKYAHAFNVLFSDCELFKSTFVKPNHLRVLQLIKLYRADSGLKKITSYYDQFSTQVADEFQPYELNNFVKNELCPSVHISHKMHHYLHQQIQMIFQDPSNSLNQHLTVYEIICEGIKNYPFLYDNFVTRKKFITKNHRDPAKDELLKIYIDSLIHKTGILPEYLARYPHQFSGGQKQRIGITRAIALQPKLIIADEPISALDMSIRGQILNLFNKLKKQMQFACLFITHDLNAVKYISDRIVVIYHGVIVESGKTEDIFQNPLHPYTKQLLKAIPEIKLDGKWLSESQNGTAKNYFDYHTDPPKYYRFNNDHVAYLNQNEYKTLKQKGKEIKYEI
ncbi:MAG: ABC transporter ATP-binding protein [Mycoplasmataceae bacterium]|nr:ABC transporter ATP-binding protein [Mycoplasmataceae bacterium]